MNGSETMRHRLLLLIDITAKPCYGVEWHESEKINGNWRWAGFWWKMGGGGGGLLLNLNVDIFVVDFLAAYG